MDRERFNQLDTCIGCHSYNTVALLDKSRKSKNVASLFPFNISMFLFGLLILLCLYVLVMYME